MDASSVLAALEEVPTGAALAAGRALAGCTLHPFLWAFKKNCVWSHPPALGMWGVPPDPHQRGKAPLDSPCYQSYVVVRALPCSRTYGTQDGVCSTHPPGRVHQGSPWTLLFWCPRRIVFGPTHPPSGRPRGFSPDTPGRGLCPLHPWGDLATIPCGAPQTYQKHNSQTTGAGPALPGCTLHPLSGNKMVPWLSHPPTLGAFWRSSLKDPCQGTESPAPLTYAGVEVFPWLRATL